MFCSDVKATAAHAHCACGRSDLGGEQTCRPEHKGIIAAPKSKPLLEIAVGTFVERRAVPNVVKADVLWEETGICTTRAAGVGMQACRERFAEITSGRSVSQQGAGSDLAKTE